MNVCMCVCMCVCIYIYIYIYTYIYIYIYICQEKARRQVCLPVQAPGTRNNERNKSALRATNKHENINKQKSCALRAKAKEARRLNE